MSIIIDVGAADCGKLNTSNTYYLFEPELEAYDRLVNRLKDNPNVKIFNTGLYNKKCTKRLYVTKKRQCSSLLVPNQNVINKYKAYRFEVEYEMDINVDRLDSYITNDIGIVDLLKLDTQGTEYDILVGCGDLLKNIRKIVCEVEHIELYKNQKLFQDVTHYLKQFDFEFVNWKRQVRWGGDLIFGDAVYINKRLK
jgi:FkbM family methyltransferase